MDNHDEEPNIGPEPSRWYNLTLGQSLLSTKSHSDFPRFYEFKPASIDKTKSGLFQKSKDNKVTLEFQNNQPNKPKVRFDGVSEDYNDRDKDAVLFFDGEIFRLEKLHRAVKRLKYLRVPDDPVSLDENEEDPYSYAPNAIVNESEEDVNIDDDDEDDNDMPESARKENTSTEEIRTSGLDIDINLPRPSETEEDEIAVVDINDDESYKGLNAAEALRAQVNAEAREDSKKSSSSSSGKDSESSSESSGSGSGNSSITDSRNNGSEGGTASESGSRASH